MNFRTFEKAFEEVNTLADRFAAHFDKHHEKGYDEAAVRKDFIDKFFTALNWDVNHNEQTNPYEQEVKVERKVNVAARVKKADYAFFIKPNFRDEKFFVEAKRPTVQLDTPDNCFQTIRYAYSSSRSAISVLTNFKEFYILDCRFRPDIATAANHIYKKYSYEDFKNREKFAEVFYLFGREAVADGSLEKFAETLPKPKGKVKQRKLFADGFRDLDDDFLGKLEEYRSELARMFKRKNPDLTSDDLTEATQRTLDRLVFIRFLEDKLIEPSTILDRFGDKPHAWKQFVAKSKDFDRSYNGIIFKPHPIIDAETFQIDDKTFLDICDDFASKYSPYHFNYIPIHILGSIYERFLGNVIEVTAKQAKVVPKPEVRKAGGVFYTPEYIVRYIVENTVGKLIEKKTPKDIAEMRFADIACGSGSFLLGVYDYLLRWHTRFYNESKNKTQAKRDKCIAHEDGTFHLSFEQKRDILTNNIYGTDIDRQAYEVTQLSLFLKLLEDETQGTKQQYLGGFRQALLPSLTDNIACGNALVDWDVTGGDLFEQLDYEKERRLNPMSFKQKFPKIMNKGGFDAIVGNPPYSYMIDAISQNYFNAKYKHQDYQRDLYLLFLERYESLLNDDGMLGVIISNTWLQSITLKKIRKYLSTQYEWVKFLHLPTKVFNAIVDTHVIIFRVKKKNYRHNEIFNVEVYSNNGISLLHKFPKTQVLTNGEPINITESLEKQLFFRKVLQEHTPLSTICNLYNGVKPFEKGKGNPPQTTQILKEKPFVVEGVKPSDKWTPLLRGSLIGRYQLFWKNDYWILYGEWLAAPRSFEIFNAPEKIVVRQTGDSIIASFIKEIFIARNNLHIILPKNPKYNLKFITAILNSKLMDFIYSILNPEKGEALAEVKKQHLEQLPIRTIDFENPTDEAKHNELVRLVDAIMQAKIKLGEARNDGEREFWTNKCNVIEENIDDIVFDLYDLTVEERNLIKNS